VEEEMPPLMLPWKEKGPKVFASTINRKSKIRKEKYLRCLPHILNSVKYWRKKLERNILKDINTREQGYLETFEFLSFPSAL